MVVPVINIPDLAGDQKSRQLASHVQSADLTQRNYLVVIGGQLVGLAAPCAGQILVISGTAQAGGLQNAKLEEVNH